MFKRFSFTIAVLFIVGINLSTNAEEIKQLKYGKVTIEELQMTKYDLDTSAEAVVLYQYAEFNPQLFNFYQHYRIKILKKAGTDIASMVFSGQLKNVIKGTTYNLEGGKIVKTKLENESIFEENVVADIYRTRIAMPNVKVGSVFEVSILMDGIPNEYEIQRNIPVIYGGISLQKDPAVNIRVKEIGYLGYTFKGNDEYIVKDMPAFKSEPYLTSENNYRVRMEFEVVSYNFSNNGRMSMGSFATSWKDVTRIFTQSQYFGALLDNMALYLNPLADSIKQMSKNEEEIAQKAFEAIKQIKWDGQETCYGSQDLKKTFQRKQGNSAEINFNLILLLRKLGLKSYPVLFSTRENGKISKLTPTRRKFNYVVAALDLPTGTYYLDATDEFIPFGTPSEQIIGCYGHAIEKDKGDCAVFIETTKKQKKTSLSQINIDSTGNCTGNISIQRSEYNSVDFRTHLKSLPDFDTYIQELESENSGWNITNFKFSDIKDNYNDFVENYDINYSSSIGNNDVLVINPFIIIKTKRNPFQKEKRYLPVNFPQQTDYTSTITINIPDNYQVAEIPKLAMLANTDKTVRYSYQIQNNGKSITITSKFTITKLQFETVEYPSLRGVYEMMLKKQNESIVLKKI